MKRNIFYFLAFFSSLLLITGCVQQVSTGQRMGEGMMDEEFEEEMEEHMEEVMGEELAEEMEERMDKILGGSSNWKDVTLKDVRTKESFKISDFKGKPILLESFAVWCPTCTKQQNQLREFHEEVGDSIISISLDTDPNEDEDRVLEHALDHGFNWLYAVSPTELTQALIDEFGVNVVNAPQTPVILICEDQSTRLLGRGVKSVETLKSEIEGGC